MYPMIPTDIVDEKGASDRPFFLHTIKMVEL